MKTVEQMAREASATGCSDELSGDSIHAFAILVMDQCADIADEESSCEGIAQRIRDNIRAAAKDLK